jgi:guanylate kinase
MVIVVCGPGGVGKGTVVREVVARDPGLVLSRSWTTRDRRPGEADDAYTFVTRDEFERRVANDGFLEWAEFLGNLYGSPTLDTPREDRPLDLLLEIDVQGAEQVRRRHPDALVVFLDAPSRAEQEARLRGRGDTDEQVAKRLAKADDEAAAAAALGATVVINDDLEQCVTEVAGLIDTSRVGRR